jgi:general secretion pathway protein A
MYESHFGITGPPFQLSPDPSFYFDSKGHHKALAEIRRGLAEKTGFIVVSGEVGAGKTTLVRTLLEEMDSSRFALGQILSTQLDADELLRAILIAFGVPAQDVAPAQYMAAVHRQVAALAKDGWRAVLIVDEAQNLHPAAFHMLVELDQGAPAGRALKVFLVGQPELRALVASNELSGLRDRIGVSCHLGPLDAIETGRYIEHRLAKVGWTGTPQFEPGAFAEIHRWTHGIPRRVNLLCNRLMLSRFLSAEVKIGVATVATTARDLRAEIGDVGPEPKPVQHDDVVEAIVLNEPIVPIVLTAAAPEETPQDAAEVTRQDKPEASPAPLLSPGATTPAELPPLVISLDTTLPSSSVVEKKAPITVRPPPAPAAPAATEPVAPEIPPVTAPVLRRDRRRPATLPPQLPPMQVQGDGSGPLLCVLASNADHLKAAALLSALATHPGLPATLLLRVYGGDTTELHSELFSPADRSRLINLGIGEGTVVGRAAELMKRFEFVVDHCEPAAVLVFDASEAALHAGLVARSKAVPVVHFGAGLRTHEATAHGDVTRRLADQLADVLYTAEAEAQMNLLREGVPAERVCFAGNLQIDALQRALRMSSDESPPPAELGDARHFLSDAHGYGLVTLDALANVSERQTLTELVTILRQVSRDLPLIWPMSERTRNQLVKFRLDAFIAGERIACVPSQRYTTFARLLNNATCVLSDSWSVQEEASALGIPCLTMGVEPGRPMVAGTGSGIPVGKNKTLATRAVWECIFNGGKPGRVPERWDGHAATRVATHLATWLVAERARRAA